MAGESKSVTKEMTAPWTETTLPTILSPYALKNIFIADEFGLFYQSLPSKTMHFNGQKCSGGKLSKMRLTGLATGNAFGERSPIFVIEKSQKLRCFKGVKHLSRQYRPQLKTWLSSELFEECVHEVNRKFGSDKQKIVLIIDNRKVHPHVEHQ